VNGRISEGCRQQGNELVTALAFYLCYPVEDLKAARLGLSYPMRLASYDTAEALPSGRFAENIGADAAAPSISILTNRAPIIRIQLVVEV
jgi:hypothetical protein